MTSSELELLARCRLFCGIPGEELPALLCGLNARRTAHCGDELLLAAEQGGRIGVLLQGRAQIVREEFSGARTLDVYKRQVVPLYSSSFSFQTNKV